MLLEFLELIDLAVELFQDFLEGIDLLSFASHFQLEVVVLPLQIHNFLLVLHQHLLVHVQQ